MIRVLVALIVPAALLGGGCTKKVVEPIRLAGDALGPMTIAVAPALNVSGSGELDSNRVADLMASELSYVAGVEVIPVNRVLAVLADQNRQRVESPGHALEIVKTLGADAILVFSVTEYDPYEPQIVGITAQLFGSRRGRVAAFNAVTASRNPRPARGGLAASPLAPVAQTQRVFDASHEWVSTQVRRFAKDRSADKSPLGWRKYLASQQHYLRFCCHWTIRTLVDAPHEEHRADATGDSGAARAAGS